MAGWMGVCHLRSGTNLRQVKAHLTRENMKSNIFQDNLVGVDFCEQMVKETNPKVWAKA
jgi:hypothetical protein